MPSFERRLPALLTASAMALTLAACDRPDATSPTPADPAAERAAAVPGVMAAVAASADIIVTGTTDASDFGGAQRVSDLPGPDGVVSLREAFTAANNTPGPQLIAFGIPRNDGGFSDGVFRIRPLSSLPEFRDRVARETSIRVGQPLHYEMTICSAVNPLFERGPFDRAHGFINERITVLEENHAHMRVWRIHREPQRLALGRLRLVENDISVPVRRFATGATADGYEEEH